MSNRGGLGLAAAKFLEGYVIASQKNQKDKLKLEKDNAALLNKGNQETKTRLTTIKSASGKGSEREIWANEQLAALAIDKSHKVNFDEANEKPSESPQTPEEEYSSGIADKISKDEDHRLFGKTEDEIKQASIEHQSIMSQKEDALEYAKSLESDERADVTPLENEKTKKAAGYKKQIDSLLRAWDAEQAIKLHKDEDIYEILTTYSAGMPIRRWRGYMDEDLLKKQLKDGTITQADFNAHMNENANLKRAGVKDDAQTLAQLLKAYKQLTGYQYIEEAAYPEGQKIKEKIDTTSISKVYPALSEFITSYKEEVSELDLKTADVLELEKELDSLKQDLLTKYASPTRTEK